MAHGHDLLSLVFFISATIGLVGFSAMSWLFPTTAWICKIACALPRKKTEPTTSYLPIRRMSIVIPAHNEERTISTTLSSMLAAIRCLQVRHPEIRVDLRVGADGCTDRTAQLARSFGAEVIESPVSRGKWRTIHELVRTSTEADWIVLSDAGIQWPETFLSQCLPYCQKSEAVGVAPTYRNPSAGIIEKLIWSFERWLKTLENHADGPVSVHGSTVMYRKRDLLIALDDLSATGTSWINDDVAIALYLRLTHPGKKVVYVPDVASWDCEASHIEASGAPVREFNRRKRMVIGNIQWCTQILLPQWRKNPLAALVTLRRIFRVTWAYWITAIVFALGLALMFKLGLSYFLIVAPIGALIGGGIGFAVVGARPLLMLADSCFVSLLAPYYWASREGLSRWK